MVFELELEVPSPGDTWAHYVAVFGEKRYIVAEISDD